jgi:phosphoglycerol transferase MdoB-like AlkP superfamily enzyme
MCPFRLYRQETVTVWTGALFAFIAETGLIVLLLGATLGGLGSAGARRTGWKSVRLCCWPLLAVYYSLVVLSCLLYVSRGSFLTTDQLVFANFLWDAGLTSVLAQRDALQFLASVAAGAAIATRWFVVMKQAGEGAPGPGLKRVTVAGVAVVVAFAAWARLALPTESLVKVRELAEHFTSPELSLLWSRVFFGKSAPTFSRVPLSLRPMVPAREETRDGSERRPNVLLIVVEALREDVIGGSDGERVMPAVTDLARHGLLFKRAYVTAPETATSLFSIVTGRFPLIGEKRFSENHPDFPFVRVYDLLSRSGYRSGYFTFEWLASRSITDSPLLDAHQDPLLDSVLSESHPTPQVGPLGDRYNVAALTRWIGRGGDPRPFFGTIYLLSSHFTYLTPSDAPRPFQPDELREMPSFLWYPPRLHAVMKNRYNNSLHFVDSLIGALVAAVRAAGLEQNTVIIVTGDHGELFHEHGQVTHSGFLYEEAIRVPLVLYGIPPRMCSRDPDLPVSLLDLPPTILSVAALSASPNFQGTALVSQDLCADTARRATKRPVFVSVQVNTNEDAIILWPWKFTRNFEGYGDRLFRLDDDAGEMHDLIASRPDTASCLRTILRRFRDRQLTYYSTPGLSSQYYAPDLVGAAGVASCDG